MWCRWWCSVGWIEAAYVTPSNKSRLWLFFWPSHFLLFSVWISWSESIIFSEGKNLFHPIECSEVDRVIFFEEYILVHIVSPPSFFFNDKTFILVKHWSSRNFQFLKCLSFEWKDSGKNCWSKLPLCNYHSKLDLATFSSPRWCWDVCVLFLAMLISQLFLRGPKKAVERFFFGHFFIRPLDFWECVPIGAVWSPDHVPEVRFSVRPLIRSRQKFLFGRKPP